MGVKILIFRRDKRVDDSSGHRRHRYEDPAFLGVFGD